MTCKLSVNINAIAYLRNRRGLPWPSVIELGAMILKAGAYGLTVHPRPDERHIKRADVPLIADLVALDFPDREFNIEGNPDARFLELVEAVGPDQVTLVPDDIRQVTSDHGWDIAAHEGFLRDVIGRLKKTGARVSLFIDPDEAQPARAAQVGADRVEIYTGPYGAAGDDNIRAVELAKVVQAGEAAKAQGLGLNAGHDLTLDNLPALVEGLPHLAEVSIGHGITADALKFGFPEAVRLYRAACGDPV